MNKVIAFTLASGLLAACGSGDNPNNGVFGSVSVANSPVSVQASRIGLSAPDDEPVAAVYLSPNEADSLNPAATVMASVQDADAEPLAVGPQPTSSRDPNKPNS